MDKKQIKASYEKLCMDNLSQTFMLWSQAIAESDRAYEKYGPYQSRHFLSNLSFDMDRPNFIGRVIKRGKKVIGFVLGNIRHRVSEPNHVFVMEHYFLEKEYRGNGIFRKLMEDLKLDFKIMGVTHIEIEDFSENPTPINGYSKSKTTYITGV